MNIITILYALTIHTRLFAAITLVYKFLTLLADLQIKNAYGQIHNTFLNVGLNFIGEI